MRFEIAPFLVLLGHVLVAVVVVSTSAAVDVDTHLESVKEIYAWVDGAEDGFVTNKISVARMVPNDLTTPLIVYATEDIEADELLITVPWTHILKSDTPELDDELGWYCGAATKLADELDKGRESFYAPYVTYLNDEPENQLPAQYSKKAKNLLRLLLGTHEEEYERSPMFDRERANNHRLMPIQVTRGLDRFWYQMCGAKHNDTMGARAASFVIQRADDYILIPAYDAFNHRNPDPHNGKDYMNARAETMIGEQHQSFAIRPIKKGEQIFISYNMCDQCGGRKYYGFGTAEMFRDYGFVEWFPQRWYYPGFGDYHKQNNDMESNQFDLYQNEDTKDLTVVWTHLTKNVEKIDRFKVFLGREIRRLNHLNHIEWADMHSWNETQWTDSGITDYEWTNIQNLLTANVVAMSIALEDLSREDIPQSLNPGNPDYDDYYDDDYYNHQEEPEKRPPLTVSEEHSSHYTDHHYDPLDAPEIDDLAYYKFTCDIDSYQNFTGYIDTETQQTGRNQVLGFWESYLFDETEDELDVCFDVNNVVQTCSSNRPYKHEMMVHLAARYIQSVKRVAIIGNGASMLLHEVVTKYDDDVEYILNLELDQSIPRKSFKHFNTDPHFDDPRVDWWFGSLEESLSVLPESYFGSFDLVLVDIPDSTMEWIVPNSNNTMDVFSALKALLKPDTGVFAKADLYFYEMERKFSNAVQLTYQSPMVCSEILSLGSDGVDFLHALVWDHDVDEMGNLLYQEPPDDYDPKRHDMVHDYRTTTSTKKGGGEKCAEQQDGSASQTNNGDGGSNTEKAFGVLQLLTFENSFFRRKAFPKESFKVTVQNLMEGVADDVGFTIVENGIVYQEDPKIVLVVMEEGYMAARIQEDDNDDDDNESFYIGFDIHLWSKIQHLDTIVGSMRDVLQSEKARKAALQKKGKLYKKDKTNEDIGDVSSHKIVLGGIFGTTAPTGTGPNSAAAGCEEKTATDDVDVDVDVDKDVDKDVDSSSLNEDIAPMVMDEVVSLTNADEIVAVAFCGSETEACTSQKVLSDHKLVKEVIPIYDCTVGTNAILEELHKCELSIIAELVTGTKRAGKLSMLVLDSGASKELHQIANSLFETYSHRGKFLKEHSVAITTWLSPRSSEEPYRLEFLDRYRKQIHHDPVRMGEFELVSSSSSSKMVYGFGVVSSNDPDANGAFHNLEQKLNKRLKGTSSSAKVQLRNLRGGLYEYVEPDDHNPKMFTQADYDQTSAQKHFDGQNPLAVQSVFQYEATREGFLGEEFLTADVVENVLREVMKILKKIGKNELHKFLVGDGGVFLLAGKTYNVIAVWDGKDRLSVNFFGVSVIAEMLAVNFDSIFQKMTKNTMNMVSVDIQPRGLGGVVNLRKDLVPIDKQSIALGILSDQEEENEIRRQQMLEEEEEEEEEEEQYEDLEIPEVIEVDDDEESSDHRTGEEL